MRFKKIVSIVILYLYLAWLSSIYAADGPSLNDVIGERKYRDYFIKLELWDTFKKVCQDYIYKLDSKNKVNKSSSMFFVIRGDRARDQVKNVFEFSCPIVVKGNMYYNLYVNWDTTLYLDVCWDNKEGYNMRKLWKDLFNLWKEVCLYYPNMMKLDKVSIIEQNNEKVKKVLPNKLWFDSILQPLSIATVLFILVLSILVWKKSF